ncbi:unnamed protein product [Sphagnum balticum]
MKPASRGNWFTGAPAQYQRTPTQTPQGMSFLDQILARAGQGLQDPQAGFQPIANEVTRQFQTETVPQLAERFTEGGGQNSAAFKGALGSAGTGLASKLAAMAAQYGLQNRQGLLQQGQLGLTPQFETQYKPENSGFLGQLLPILGAAGGAYLGGYSGSGKKDEAGKAGKGVGQFLQGLTEGKLKKMHQQQQVDQLRKAYPDLDEESLEFLASRPPKEQLQYLQQHGAAQKQRESQAGGQPQGLESITEDEKKIARQALSHPEFLKLMTQDQIQKLQKYLNPEMHQGAMTELEDYQSEPGLKDAESFLKGPLPYLQGGKAPEPISGLNKLTQAGNGFGREAGESGRETQMFPQEGRGTKGQAGPIESPQPKQRNTRLSDLVPKSGGEGSIKNELARQKLVDTQQKRPLNYLDAQAKHFTALKSAADVARKMEAILEEGMREGGPQFPSQLLGVMASDNPVLKALTIKNPLISEYTALGNELVSNLAGARKGAVTNFKLKLERASKADISQPIETQLARVRSVIDAENREGERIEYLESLANENGEYPQNIAGQGVKYDRAHENPLQYPSFFPEGTQDTDKNGVVREIKNGLGDVAEAGLREANAPDLLRGIQRVLAPSFQQAKDEAEWGADKLLQGQEALSNLIGAKQPKEKLTGKYFTESRPEDWFPELLTHAAVPLGIGAKFRGLKGLGKAGLRHLGMIGGSKIGGAVGGEVGGAIGFPETGEKAGNLLGGLTVAATPKAIKKFNNRPSKFFSLDEYDKRANALEKTITPLYEKAEQLEHGKTGDITSLNSALTSLNEQLALGADPADVKLINSIVSPLETEISNGTSSLKNLKQFEKNYNAQIYDKNTSSSFKQLMRPLNNAVAAKIAEIGSPEHTETYLASKSAKREHQNLKKGRKAVEAIHKLSKDESLRGAISSLALGALGHVLGKGIIGAAFAGAKEGYKLWNKNTAIAARVLENNPAWHAEWVKLGEDMSYLPYPEIVERIKPLAKKLDNAVRRSSSR